MKLKQKKSSKRILSDKIADALTVKTKADIEDDQIFGTKPTTVSRADFGSSESEDEAAISDFRKRNVNLLSEISKKYEGQVVSRKEGDENNEGSCDNYEESDSDNNALSAQDLFSSNKDETSDDSDGPTSQIKAQKKVQVKSNTDLDDFLSAGEGEDEDNNFNRLKKHLLSGNDDDDNDQRSDDEGSDDEESDDEGSANERSADEGSENEGYDISQLEEPVKEEFEHVKKQNLSEDAKKGNCVRNQLLMWEGLLEMRIHLQRCVNTANQMPMTDTYDQLKDNDEFVDQCNTTKANICKVLDKFLTLQNILLKNFPETKSLAVKKQGVEQKQETKEESDEEIPSDTDNEEIPSDTEPEDEGTSSTKAQEPDKSNVNKPLTKKRKLEDYEKEISMTHKAFKPFRDGTIQKWNDKTRLATATNIKNAPTNSILQQISYILSDREKLVRRTQLKRSEYDIIGHKKMDVNEESSAEDLVLKGRKDDDEYIPEIFDDSDFYHQLLRELIECKSADISDPVQLSRQWIALQQMRSKMKRKVDTKATKGRKIKYVVHNPLVNYMAPEKSTTWNDESINELFSSLFGKMFESNNTGLNVNLENGFKIKE